MMDCLDAIRTFKKRFAVQKLAYAALLAAMTVSASPAHAVFTAQSLIPTPQEDVVGDDDCAQAWPVSCEAGSGEGDTGCGSWRVLTDLAQPDYIPNSAYNSSSAPVPGGACSTGIRLGLNNDEAEGEAVGAMFPGTVIFSQSGRGRDGVDYGGVVVIKLELDDGSPQCYARYMFLDRRDLVPTGAEIEPGQRIGSIANSDMNATKDWWKRNWPGLAAHVKIDIGCDEALANLPMFMPYEAYTGSGPDDEDSCPLTKMRFPTRPYEYLTSFESVKNTGCSVGARKDMRGGLTPAVKQDDTELETDISGRYVDKAKPRGYMKRKTTDVYSLFAQPGARENFWGANPARSSDASLFRDSSTYADATSLGCNNMAELFNGGPDGPLTPEQVRELMNHCTNQYVLGRSMFYKVFEDSDVTVPDMENPIPRHLVDFLSEDEQETYKEWQDERAAPVTEASEEKPGLEVVQPLINKVYWRDLCQPLAMQPVGEDFNDYKVREILTKAWTEALIDWPTEHGLVPINREPIQTTELDRYAEYPYERIIDPTNPFSPRQIFAETERERYKNYGVQCAATPVDIILGDYGKRDGDFHQCIRCRIQINEQRQACIPDPYSFTNEGGCSINSGYGGDASLCTNLDPTLKTLLNALEVKYGLAPNFLHAIATAESSCRPDAVSEAGALGMFQFLPGTAAEYGIDPLIPEQAAEGSARYYSDNASLYNCELLHMVGGYHCGQGCATAVYEGRAQYTDPDTLAYANRVSALLGGIQNGCSANGPFPNGNGTSSATSGSSSSGGGLAGGEGDVFGSGSGGGQFSSMVANFDSNRCPEGYVGNENSFVSEDGTRVCPAFSYPTPELPGTGGYGCRGRDFFPPGCDASCQNRFLAGCAVLRNYNGPTDKSMICDPAGSCPGRIHEGMDISPAFGSPIFAAANGKVSSINDSGYVTIDHSGACIDPACTKRFASGVNTRYYHMGLPRVMVQVGEEVKRCQQIATVGDVNSPGAPHLHFETHDAANTMSTASYGYYPLAQDQRYHSHVDDQSCGEGVWDAQGKLGGQGICSFALPLNKIGKEDLTPPPYYETHEEEEVEMPEPPSADDLTPFDLEVDGYSLEGKWTACDDPKLTQEQKETCIKFNEELEESGAFGSTQFINPAPCFASSSPFGPRCDPTKSGCVPSFHCGLDISAPTASPVLAAADGVVEAVDLGVNRIVTIRHADGSRTAYLHEEVICPEIVAGATVKQGQVIGHPGTRGQSTGVHLHFDFTVPKITSTTAHNVPKCAANSAGYAGGNHFDDPQLYIPAQTPTSECRAAINNAQCGQIVTGLSVGPGVGGGNPNKKTLCIDKPCSVRYDEADTIAQCAWSNEDGGCGTLGNYSQRDEGESGDCCYKITAPVAPMNMLKIRPGYDNEAFKPGAVDVEDFQPGAWPGERVDDGLEDGTKGEGGEVPVSADNPGAPEGYTFHEFFRNHRPYMRWWDTGAESGNILQGHTDADSMAGSYDALVGVGTEKNSCGIGGWGDPNLLDGNSSWMELKLYQARSQFMGGMRCITRYEKLYKRGSAEDYVLRLAGGNFTVPHVSASGIGSGKVDWPLAWRGYASEPIAAYRFPYLVNMDPNGAPEYSQASGSMLGGGLDNALPGDILIWDQDVVGHNRPAHVAYVVSADNSAMSQVLDNKLGGSSNGDRRRNPLSSSRLFETQPKSEGYKSLVIKDYNYGKYPDSCGNTNWWGVGPERKIYKTLPEGLKTKLESMGATQTDCGNSDLTSCQENYWGQVKIYRPWSDVRE